MINHDTKSDSKKMLWTWLPVFVALSVSIDWFTEFYAFSFEFYIFLPILTGWLSSRFGIRIIGPLLVLGVLSASHVSINLTDRLEVGLGGYAWVHVLSVCTAVVFCRPAFPQAPTGLFLASRHWLRWLLPVGIWLAVFKDRSLRWEPGDGINIYSNPGFLLLAFLLISSLDWAVLRSWVRTIFPTADRKYLAFLVVFSGLVMLSYLLSIFVDIEIDYWYGSVGFGTWEGFVYITLIAFILSASGRVDWRLLIVLLVIFYVSDLLFDWLIEVWASAFPEPSALPVTGSIDAPVQFPNDLLEEITVKGSPIRQYIFLWPGIIQGIAATLLGAAIGPFLRQSNPGLLRDHRSSYFLLSTLVVIYMGMAAIHYGIDSLSTMLIGGTAYILGLAWQVRGIIVGTLIIQLMYLTSLFFFAVEREGLSVFDVSRIGFVAFVFAFFGLLSNRYKRWSQTPDATAAAEGSN